MGQAAWLKLGRDKYRVCAGRDLMAKAAQIPKPGKPISDGLGTLIAELAGVE